MNSNEYQTTFGELTVGQLFTRDGWNSVAVKILPYDTTGADNHSWVNYRVLEGGSTGWCDDEIPVRTAPRDAMLAKQFAIDYTSPTCDPHVATLKQWFPNVPEDVLAKHFEEMKNWSFLIEVDTWEGAAQVIADDIVKLIARKQHDYGHGNILGFGEMGVAVRVWDKVNRLKTLLVDRKDKTATGEGVEDTWTDLAGYAIIALMLRRGWFTLPLKEDKEA